MFPEAVLLAGPAPGWQARAMSSDPPTVVHLGAESLDEATDALCDAFRDYPVMRFVLKDAGEDYTRRLRALVAFFTDSRLARGYPVLGLRRDGRLLAAANVNPSHRRAAPRSLREHRDRLDATIGEAAVRRYEAFAASGDPFEPAEPHVHLGMIGVRREAQGQGLARVLLERVHALSAADPESVGVTLTTEMPGNVALYEHFGYTVRGHARLDELESWSMFRPDPR
jgi:GNAT superfamily N-acetyltransferase